MGRPAGGTGALDTPEAVRKKALSLLERRDYGEAELRAKLVEKGAGEEDAAAAARRMAELGFINDANYAAMVARHYSAKGYGPERIRAELRRRKLGRELWDGALGAAPDSAGAAYAVFKAKMRGGTDRDALRRASAALARRGFGWDEVKAAMERYLAETETENDE